MKPRAAAWIVLSLLAALPLLAGPQQTETTTPAQPDFTDHLRISIEGYLGKPYSWGATGSKSFDCSGFVWRVMVDNGVLFKRTTARKLSMSLRKPEAGKTWEFGNIVFFNNYKHCGIVKGAGSFYHAQTSLGTNESEFSPYWQPKIVGIRCFRLTGIK